eukprot:c32091_g1_i1.p1 GENE.c32091_g1_i1~~c32091_g1_i1.p1  ORF type:complete len:349 (-),score=85.32 c32091_g1_i1:30-1076(-)
MGEQIPYMTSFLRAACALAFVSVAFSDCSRPDTSNCEFYKDCLRPQECKISRNVMYPKCVEYKEVIPQFSAQGKVFLNFVRGCLQEHMASEFFPSTTTFTCDQFQESFFRNHVPCYTTLNPASFCTLGLGDQARVFWHAKDMLWSGFIGSTTKAGLDLLAQCNQAVSLHDLQLEDALFGLEKKQLNNADESTRDPSFFENLNRALADFVAGQCGTGVEFTLVDVDDDLATDPSVNSLILAIRSQDPSAVISCDVPSVLNQALSRVSLTTGVEPKSYSLDGQKVKFSVVNEDGTDSLYSILIMVAAGVACVVVLVGAVVVLRAWGAGKKVRTIFAPRDSAIRGQLVPLI